MAGDPSLPLDGRVAIVTGASRGIGRAIALHLRSLGARIVINHASNSNQAHLLASELNASANSSHPIAIAVQADVSNPDQVKLLFDRAEQEFGSQAHILVNCAGVLDPKYPTLSNTTVEDWDMTFNINTKGAFLCCREATKRLTRGGGGRIIMISTSVVGSLPPGYAAYAASKAAVEAMTKIVAKELKGTGITANCVAPGPVATEMFFAGKTEEMVKTIVDACPLGRLGDPNDIAQIVGFLAGDAGERVSKSTHITYHQSRVMAELQQGTITQLTQIQQQSPLPLHDRVAIVTGASRGIGRAIALHLASLGAKLVINYTSNSAQAQLVASQINSDDSLPPRAIIVQADVSDPAQVKSLFDAAESAFNSQPHILVNSAGVLDAKYPTIPNTSIEDFDRTFSVNTRGSFLCCKEAANRLRRGGGGRIICLTTSLVAALRPGFGAYVASKAAVEAMIKILAKELKGSGITANCVAPGPIATEMFFTGKTEEQVKKSVDECPLSRLGETKDVAPVVGFLASDAGEWVNGQVIRVNGGYV
ncbi:hypothetical protein F0562_016549 [Nyssa sinensis]|uniref:Ketoreductase domain-containing protein n=1 Tax=Nyssa sinensis TaxID=561372 RepID=A0A5J4ZES3_9ASTE|nr:hypothetical protein F0562_016549 [Nyssa sinensis]